jgi:hypothetical protein
MFFIAILFEARAVTKRTNVVINNLALKGIVKRIEIL